MTDIQQPQAEVPNQGGEGVDGGDRRGRRVEGVGQGERGRG